jgi:hypothetical protein
MKSNDPESWQDAVAFDKAIREQPKLNGKAFLHRSLKPLDEVDFDKTLQFDLGMDEECEGMCGL